MALTQVTSAGIKDGEIVNADLNSSAAIALSKLATSGTAGSGNYLRGDGAWTAIDLSTKLNLTGGTLTGNVIHNDSVKALFGTGSDLQIFHDGAHSDIKNGQGNLHIRNDGETNIQNNGGNENRLKTINNGAVELYYDNSKKLETTSDGATVSGSLKVGDNNKIKVGDGADLQLYHNATDSFIKNFTGDLLFRSDNGLKFENNGGNESLAIFNNNSYCQLYYDNSKKFETLSNGAKITGDQYLSEGTIYLEKSGVHHHRILSNDTGNDLGFQQSSDSGANTNFTTYLRIDDGGDISLPVDGKKLLIGAGDDIQIYHDGTDSYIDNDTGNLFIRNDTSGGGIFLRVNGTEAAIAANKNGAVELYYDASKKFETTSTGTTTTGNATITGHIYQGDSDVHYLGAGPDLAIWHDGSHSYIRNTAGSLKLSVDGGSDEIQLNKGVVSEHLARFVADGHVGLYYDSSLKFYTQSTKNVSAGHFYPESNNTYDLGHSSYRWANLYVNDMHFANSPENTNSVDGTWGDWTLQEGDENIFMINNRTGRKYKMGLVEVS